MTTKLTYRLFFVTLGWLLSVNVLIGQQVFDGFVYDQSTTQPIPFANVSIHGSSAGTATDTSGYFRFTTHKKVDSLRISSLGYRTQFVHLPLLHDTIFLQSQTADLGVFEVRPGINPAFAVLDRVVAAKSQNQPFALPHIQFEEYQKIRFDLNHFSDKIKRNFLLRPFDYLWENEGVDTSGVRYLPALLVEKYIEHYRQQNNERSIIQGEKITGLAGPRLMDFVSDLYIMPNIYENFVQIFEKQFPSPIHDNYKRYYRYYLMDSVEVQHRKTYLIAYKPKYGSQRAFTGLLKVDSLSSAVQDITLRFDLQANVNFVRSYLIRQSYKPIDRDYWVVDTSAVLGDFTILENASDLTGFFGRKISVFDRYNTINEPDASIFAGPLSTISADSARLRSRAYWDTQRRVELDEDDEGIEAVSDRLALDPRFIFRKNLLLSIGTGFIPWGPIEIGDFYSFYSYNQVEFGRFKFGARLRETENRPLEINGYGAYGLRDDRWKYLFSGHYRHDFDVQRKLWFGGSVRNDIAQLTRSFNTIPIDHVFASIAQFRDDDSRYYSQRASAFVALQPLMGFTLMADYTRERFETIWLSRESSPQPGIHQTYNAGSVGVTAKLSWLNSRMRPFFDDSGDVQKRFGPLPDIYFEGRIGSPDVGSEVSFKQARLAVQQFIPVANAGHFHYRVDAAKTWGNMPHVFSYLPYANPIIFNDQLAFNLMNFMEFYMDEYAQLAIAHHFEGWILDRIPLVKKLKLRSFLFAKGIVGDARLDNPYLADLPISTTVMRQPYYEMGFGIENIIKFARVDFVWRYTDQNAVQQHYAFLIKPSFRFAF